MRTSSIWDPAAPSSPVSCSLDMDWGRKVPSRQGEWGHVSDIRYLFKLGASGKGEEIGLSEMVEFTSLYGLATFGIARSYWYFTALDAPHSLGSLGCPLILRALRSCFLRPGVNSKSKGKGTVPSPIPFLLLALRATSET